MEYAQRAGAVSFSELPRRPSDRQAMAVPEVPATQRRCFTRGNAPSGDVCGSAQTGSPAHAPLTLRTLPETHMYIGGLLGTILLVALIVYVLRRA